MAISPDTLLDYGNLAGVIACAMTAALVAGVRRVLLEAREANAPARAFYRRLGYRERVGTAADPLAH